MNFTCCNVLLRVVKESSCNCTGQCTLHINMIQFKNDKQTNKKCEVGTFTALTVGLLVPRDTAYHTNTPHAPPPPHTHTYPPLVYTHTPMKIFWNANMTLKASDWVFQAGRVCHVWWNI